MVRPPDLGHALQEHPLDLDGKLAPARQAETFVQGRRDPIHGRNRDAAAAQDLQAAAARDVRRQGNVAAGHVTALHKAQAASALGDGLAEARFERGLAMLIDGAVRA